MKKVYKESQLVELNNIPVEVIKCVKEPLIILNENYGADRDVDNDLGGYVLMAENIVDIEVLRQGKLQGLIPEYTDIIGCSEGVNWTSLLFLLLSDFAIVILLELIRLMNMYLIIYQNY